MNSLSCVYPWSAGVRATCRSVPLCLASCSAGIRGDQLSHTPSPPEPVFLISPSGCQSQPSRADKARADTCGWTFLNSEVERVQESAIYARYFRKARGDQSNAVLTSGDSPCKGRDTCAWAGLRQGRDTLEAMAWMVWFLVSCGSGSGPLWTLLILGAAAHPGLLLELLPNALPVPSFLPQKLQLDRRPHGLPGIMFLLPGQCKLWQLQPEALVLFLPCDK